MNDVNDFSYLYVPNAQLHAKIYLFREIPQLGQLIQQLLQIPIGYLILQTRDQRFGFFRIVAAQTSCSCISKRNVYNAWKHTQLRPLKHLQFRMRVQQPFHRLDVFLVLKPGKHLQIIQCFGEIPSRASTH